MVVFKTHYASAICVLRFTGKNQILFWSTDRHLQDFCVSTQIIVIVIVREHICLELVRMPNECALLPVDVTAVES